MKAAFIDRDGVINELCYFPDADVIDSPFTPRQVRLLPHAAKGIRLLNRLGLKVVVISNQPGVAKKNLTLATLTAINDRILEELHRRRATIDGIYCCLHHPQAKLKRWKKRCDCRKPKPGLILRAASEMQLDVRRSYMLGDSLSDIQAGCRAGCKTIFVGRWKCDICRFMSDYEIQPDFVAGNLFEAARLIEELEA